MRRLNSQDIGKVFVLNSPGSQHDYYLLLSSIGPGADGILSFITFRLEGGNVVDVADTGCFPGAFYDAAAFIPDSIIDEVKKRHALFVQERLREIKRMVDESGARKALSQSLPGRSIEHYICPVCLNIFPLSEVSGSPPTCPACESEALTVEIRPYDIFLKEVSLARLQSLLVKWNAAKGFLESYKQVKRERIESLIAAKISMGPPA